MDFGTDCLVNIDEIIIFSKDFAEHLDNLEYVLSFMEDTEIHLKLKKCLPFKD